MDTIDKKGISKLKFNVLDTNFLVRASFMQNVDSLNLHSRTFISSCMGSQGFQTNKNVIKLFETEGKFHVRHTKSCLSRILIRVSSNKHPHIWTHGFTFLYKLKKIISSQSTTTNVDTFQRNFLWLGCCTSVFRIEYGNIWFYKKIEGVII